MFISANHVICLMNDYLKLKEIFIIILLEYLTERIAFEREQLTLMKSGSKPCCLLVFTTTTIMVIYPHNTIFPKTSENCQTPDCHSSPSHSDDKQLITSSLMLLVTIPQLTINYISDKRQQNFDIQNLLIRPASGSLHHRTHKRHTYIQRTHIISVGQE